MQENLARKLKKTLIATAIVGTMVAVHDKEEKASTAPQPIEVIAHYSDVRMETDDNRLVHYDGPRAVESFARNGTTWMRPDSVSIVYKDSTAVYQIKNGEFVKISERH